MRKSIFHGTIFACFMLACMVGSSLAGKLMSEAELKVEKYMQVVFIVATVSLTPPLLVDINKGSTSDSVMTKMSWQFIFGGFLIFELCVGMFWPSLMKMRSGLIPEELRSTVMNIFRIPLNLFVCLVLYNIDKVSTSIVFSMCITFLLICSILQRRMHVVTELKVVLQSNVL